MANIWILAQGPAGQAQDTEGSVVTSEPVTEQGQTTVVVSDSNSVPPSTPRKQPFGNTYWIFIGLMLLMMYFVLFRGPRRKQQEQRKMVQSLQKNDRVRTIGGIIGTVVDVKDDEVTLKVDESNNTKIKIISSAIGRNFAKQ
ncbi:MAG: preprotein translocase subunit YajC [Sedimentisphaerales bacterium]|nr:preprotein translocase subunit YajC [Sedimentisphaerales bacterium]